MVTQFGAEWGKVSGMKKIMMAAVGVGLAGILASCGTSGVAPDGSGSGRVVDLTTEYATSLSSNTATTQYAACDNVTNSTDVTRSKSTQVVVEFVAAGSITSVDIRLIGINSGDNGKFYKNISINDLKKLSNGNYRVIFDANSATGGLLPNSLNSQSIVITPVTEEPRPVKAITGQNKLEGGFYAELIVYTNTSQTPPFNSRNLRVIPIYTSCSLNGVAKPLKL
ncbi:Lipoprotein [Deinococcus saxicola]|uniref:hypothetical protein n=1 Tax=Deinococcus saxicola TaxID=249406 RepID=UPI0039F0490D